MRRSLSRRTGFTLLEGMIAVALLSLLLSLATPSWSSWIQRQRLEIASRQLQSGLAQLRRLSLDAQQPVRLSLLTSPTFPGGTSAQCVVLHTGTPTDCLCSADGRGEPVATCKAPARRLSTLSVGRKNGLTLTGNVSSLRMDPRLGTVTPTGTLTLTSSGELEVKHIVNVLGRVRVCSDARIGGWPTC